MTTWREAGFCQENKRNQEIREEVVFNLSLIQRARICCMKEKEKMRKTRTEDKKVMRKEFGRNDFLIKDMKAFFNNFLICISNSKS